MGPTLHRIVDMGPYSWASVMQDSGQPLASQMGGPTRRHRNGSGRRLYDWFYRLYGQLCANQLPEKPFSRIFSPYKQGRRRRWEIYGNSRSYRDKSDSRPIPEMKNQSSYPSNHNPHDSWCTCTSSIGGKFRNY